MESCAGSVGLVPIIAGSVASGLVVIIAASLWLMRKRRQAALSNTNRAALLSNANQAALASSQSVRRWDFFISHVQSETKDIAADLYHTLYRNHGLTSWLDVKMPDRSVLAMEEGVRLSDKVLVVVSLSYFSRPFCVKELRWAVQYGKEVVVAIPVELKERIGEILKDCPDDLRSIGDIDFKTVDRGDVEHFELSLRQLIHPRVGRRIAPLPVPVPTLLIEDESSQANVNNVQLPCSSRTSPLKRP
jgi:hypothetical protein